MTTKIVNGSFSEGFRETYIESLPKGIQFREWVAELIEDLGLTMTEAQQEMDILFKLQLRQNAEAQEWPPHRRPR